MSNLTKAKLLPVNCVRSCFTLVSREAYMFFVTMPFAMTIRHIKNKMPMSLCKV